MFRKGPVRGLICPRDECRSNPLKGAQTLCKRDSFSNFKALFWGIEACCNILCRWKLVGAIFRLSLWFAKASECLPPTYLSPPFLVSFLQTPSATHQSTSSSRREPLHTCGACVYIWRTGLRGCHPEDAPLPPGSGDWGAYVLGTRDYNSWKYSSWQTTTPWVLHRQQTETHPYPFSERGLAACSGPFAWQQISSLVHWLGPTDALREWRPMDAIFMLSLCLTPAC